MPDIPSGSFFITTPIYYVTAAPHIGSAYTTTAADVLFELDHLLDERGLDPEPHPFTAPAVVPPGLEEISATNAAKIAAYSAEVSAVLAGASAMQALYGVANSVAGTVTSLEDAANAVLMNAVL